MMTDGFHSSMVLAAPSPPVTPAWMYKSLWLAAEHALQTEAAKAVTTTSYSLDTRMHAFVLTCAVPDGAAAEPKL